MTLNMSELVQAKKLSTADSWNDTADLSNVSYLTAYSYFVTVKNAQVEYRRRQVNKYTTCHHRQVKS